MRRCRRELRIKLNGEIILALGLRTQIDVTHHVHRRRPVHFIENSSFVRADGLNAQFQLCRNVTWAHAGCEHPQNVELTSRKISVPGEYWHGAGGGKRGRERLGKILLPCEHVSDGLEQFGAGLILADVTRRAELQAPGSILMLAVHAQYQNAGIRARSADFLKQLQAVFSRETNVKNNEMPAALLDQQKSFSRSGGFAKGDATKLLLEYLRQPAADDQMIVNNQNRQHMLVTWLWELVNVRGSIERFDTVQQDRETSPTSTRRVNLT